MPAMRECLKMSNEMINTESRAAVISGDQGARKPVLTSADLTKCGLRWFMSVLTFNYETQLACSVVFAEKHALRKIYQDDDEAYKKSLENQFRYFNITPPVAGFLLGAGLAMEDTRGTDALDAVQDLKVGLMGSLSGVADTIIWILVPTIMGSIAAYMAQAGNPVGMFIWLFVALFVVLLKVKSWNIGYKFGAALITTLADKVSAFTEAASILGLTVVGALIPTVVKINTGLTFTMGDVSLGLQEGILDAILVGLLPVCATAIVYALVKRGVSMTWIIIGIVVLSCLGAATGVLAV